MSGRDLERNIEGDKPLDNEMGKEIDEEINSLLHKKLSIVNREYIRGVNRDLSQQHWQEILGRNFINTLRLTLHDLENERCFQDYAHQQCMEVSQKLLLNFSDTALQQAIKHNRSSCAISNFGDEHNPPPDYISNILMQSELMIKEFLLRFQPQQ